MPQQVTGASIQDSSSQTLYVGFPFIGFGFCLLFGFVVCFFFSVLEWLTPTVAGSDIWNHRLPFPQSFQSQQSCKCWGSASGMRKIEEKWREMDRNQLEIFFCALEIISCFHTLRGQPSLETAFDLN